MLSLWASRHRDHYGSRPSQKRRRFSAVTNRFLPTLGVEPGDREAVPATMRSWPHAVVMFRRLWISLRRRSPDSRSAAFEGGGAYEVTELMPPSFQFPMSALDAAALRRQRSKIRLHQFVQGIGCLKLGVR